MGRTNVAPQWLRLSVLGLIAMAVGLALAASSVNEASAAAGTCSLSADRLPGH